MKKYLLSLSIVISISAFSQEQNLKLSDYKFADFKRHQLDINFYLSGINQGIRANDTLSSKNNSFAQSIDIFHSFYTNNRKYQGLQSGSVFIQNQNSNFKTNSFSSRDSYFRFDFNYTSENRLYNAKQWFVEFSPMAAYTSQKTNTNNTNFRRDQNQNNLTLKLPVGIGKGRIERVEDYRMAIFIEDVITKNQNSTRLNTAQLLELAAKITQLKNRRFYDFRLQRIYEIESLDSLFTDFGIATGSAAYFTKLYDYWLYANNPIRESGFRVTVMAETSYQRFELGGSFVTDTSNISNSSLSETSWLGPKLLVYYAIPFQLNWQFTAAFSSYYNFLLNPSSENNFSPTLQNNIFAKLGFYPNTRSFAEASIGYQNYHTFFKDVTDLTQNIAGRLDAYYYLSPQLRLNVNYSIASEIIDLDNFNRNNWFQQYSVRFTYMIF